MNKAALFFALAFFTPSVITLPFQSPRITALRAVLLVMFFPALLTFLKGVERGDRSLRGSDCFVLLACTCLLIALTITEGLGVSMVSGNLYVLEFLGGYVLMRAYFRTRADYEALIRYLKWGTILAICIALLDRLHGYHWFSTTIARHIGQVAPDEGFRNGVLRAQSTFDHPILYGTFCAFAGVIFCCTAKTPFRALCWLGLCAFGCFLAQSSAPLLALAIGIGLIVYDRILRSFPWRWKLMLAGIALGICAVMILSQNPLSFFIRNFTLDPQTGFYRLLIWEYAGAEVLRSPLVGIGFREWAHPAWMSGSVDTLWLGLASTYGIPAAVFFGLVLLSAMRRSGPPLAERYLDPYLVRLSQSLSMVLSLSVFVCFTVYFWGAMWTFLAALAALRTNLEEGRSMQARLLLSGRGSARPSATQTSWAEPGRRSVQI